MRGGRNTGRIFSRPTWRSVLFSPRGIAALLVIAVIGAGGLGINAKIQRDKAEEAARIEAKKEKERLAKQTVDPFKLGPTAIPVSTPRSQWTAGPMPHLYQTDPLWANKPYAGSNIRIAGCGPTSLSMVYTYLTGKTDLDPVAMASFAEEHNFAPTGATEWRFMTDGAAAIGLRSTPVAPSRASIASALDAGMPIICCLTPGDFTTVGHFLVIKGMDSRGMVEIHDPNSPYNSAKRWPISQILPQIEALWAFSL
ncbi:MAG: C39 family peptidase [Collinsella intestinalis]|uniref:C39 family peptidase n=1 Tax=Collinsella intestinalis TaxID=147207 RepID=UPI003A4AD507|nr:C39 family peptidase [Collinsella intestinalis]